MKTRQKTRRTRCSPGLERPTTTIRAVTTFAISLCSGRWIRVASKEPTLLHHLASRWPPASMVTCRPIPGWLRGWGRGKKKRRGRRKVAFYFFLFGFCIFPFCLLVLSCCFVLFFCCYFFIATNPFSTTSRAVAHKGAETRRTWREGRKTMKTTTTRKSEKSRELRSKAPGHRVSMRSV